ncbi:MAG: aminotransferase class IV [Gammaproteobacteria bacterium]|nr:aminotransferase class IV [Gammaproteobacteria bacterium]
MQESTTVPAAFTEDAAYAAGCAWVDGAYLPIADARIPITDTGFTRSDCTYDVVAVWHGRFFRLDAHLARFERSWQALRLSPPLDRDGMAAVLHECVRRSGLRDAYVEMVVTRGSPPPGVRDPRRFANRFYAFAIPYVWIATPEVQARGLHLAIARDVVRIPPQAVDPRVKNFHWADLTRGLFEAYEREAETVVLLNAAGEVTEGPGFNLFAWCDDVLWTPAAGVLEGITRDTVLALAAEHGLATRVAAFDAALLARADEIFLTSTAGGIMPVSRLDGRPVGDGRPGEITRALSDNYWRAHDEPRWSTPVQY